jgi:hypothetical protein
MLGHQAFLLFILVLFVISMACIVSCERHSSAPPYITGGSGGTELGHAGGCDIAQYVVPTSS